MENFRNLWFEDKLIVIIRNVKDLAKFNSLYRFLLYKCNINLKITYDYNIIAKALRRSDTVYVMKNGTFRDSWFANHSNHKYCDIDKFVNLFKSEQLLIKIEDLLNELEENNEKNKDNN